MGLSINTPWPSTVSTVLPFKACCADGLVDLLEIEVVDHQFVLFVEFEAGQDEMPTELAPATAPTDTSDCHGARR